MGRPRDMNTGSQRQQPHVRRTWLQALKDRIVLILAVILLLALGALMVVYVQKTKTASHKNDPSGRPAAQGASAGAPSTNNTSGSEPNPGQSSARKGQPGSGGPEAQQRHSAETGNTPPTKGGKLDWRGILLPTLGALAGGFLGGWMTARIGRQETSTSGGKLDDPQNQAVRLLHTVSKRLDQLEGKLHSLNSGFSDLRNQLDKQGELENLRNEKDRLTRELTEAGKTAGQAARDREAAKRQVEDLKQANERQKSQISELESSLETARSKIEDKDREIQQMKDDLGDSDLDVLVIRVEDTLKNPGPEHREAVETLVAVGRSVYERRFTGSDDDLKALDSCVYSIPRELVWTLHAEALADSHVRQIIMLQRRVAQELKKQGLNLIFPTDGDPFDDGRHEFSDDGWVLHSDRNMDGRIYETKRPGYEFQGRVLRKALVRRYIAR